MFEKKKHIIVNIYRIDNLVVFGSLSSTVIIVMSRLVAAICDLTNLM